MFAMIGCSTDSPTDLNFIIVGSYYVYECEIGVLTTYFRSK